MKSRLQNSMATASLLASLMMPPALLVAQPTTANESTLPRYVVTDLGTLQGGTFSQPFFINKSGLVAGSSTNAGGSQNAVLWLNSTMNDIGAPGLGGANSIAFAVNDRGASIGEAEDSVSDPNGEDFCGFGTHVMCLPFLSENSAMTPLPTLGGHNGMASLINNQGQIVGVSEVSISDPGCPGPQKLQFKPVYWENGHVHKLPTHRGDPDGIAFAINDHGQIVGGSGTCAAFNPINLNNLLSRHALLWQNGTLTDIGNLGGKTGQAGGNYAIGINNRGQVIGTSDLSGDTAYHAFLWTKATGMQDLNALSGDVDSSAVSINNRGVVVGGSIDTNGNPRAFIWEKGVMTDLNTLTTNSPLYLFFGCAINDEGVITGLGLTASGELHTYLATPLSSEESASYARLAAPLALSEEVRALVRQQMQRVRFAATPKAFE